MNSPPALIHPFSHLLPNEIQNVLSNSRRCAKKIEGTRRFTSEILHYVPRKDLQEGMMLLPFRTRRFEKNNNNGERKQIKYEIKRIRVNE